MAGKGQRVHVTARSASKPIEWASPQQQEAFEYGPYPLCVSGGFGAAKTWGLCLKVLWLSDTFPNNRGIIARKVWEELKNTTMSTFFKICPPEAYDKGRRADSEKYLRLNNGSEILWMHMEDADLEGVIRGLEINWFLLDQAEEIAEDVFDLLLPRLGRWEKAEVPRWFLDSIGGEANYPWKVGQRCLVPTYPLLSCNPDTELHWLYRRFHPDSPDWAERFRDRGYKLITMSSRENKFLPKQNLDILLQNDDMFIRRFVDGVWGIPEGTIHRVDALSIIPGDRDFVEHLRRTCTLHRTLDHGDASPTCCLWWAVDRDGNVFCFREYYQPNRLISDHRASITALSADELYVFNLADPSIFYKTMQKYGGRWSVADEYSDHQNLPKENALYWQPADNNEEGTRNRISEYLRVDPERIHPYTKQKGAPRLFFVERSVDWPQGARHAIQQTRSQRYVRVGTDLGRAVYGDGRCDNIPDHAYDPVRYFIASRPPVGYTPGRKYGRRSFGAVRQQFLDMKRTGLLDHLAEEARGAAV